VTLLEALAALVILGVSAVGYLELFHGAGRSVRDADEWTQAASVAASALDAATLGAATLSAPAVDVAPPSPPPGYTHRLERRAWLVNPQVTELVVTVTTPTGASMTVHRLARTRR
jgi:type II secretory pathway pseudopilin PulG